MTVARQAAKPLTIVPPLFPPKAQAPAPGVRVDVLGTVAIDGQLKQTSITAPEGHAPFVESVADVSLPFPACANGR
jgi:hypothetical protein